MNKLPLTVVSSVNAGLCLIFPSQEKIWIDFFPSGETRLFSFLDEQQWQQIKKNPVCYPPDCILFTHTHPDHYCSRRALEMQQSLPEALIMVPLDPNTDTPGFIPSGAIRISGHEAKLQYGALTIRFFASRHSGRQYEADRHYSIFLSYAEKTIFISGDADFRFSSGLIEEAEKAAPQLAILTFPWAATFTGRELLENQIRPEHVLLYHVPQTEEDREGFRAAALGCVSMVNVPDCRVLSHRMQVEKYLL